MRIGAVETWTGESVQTVPAFTGHLKGETVTKPVPAACLP